MPSKKKSHSNQLRIIAGEWRGRKLAFPDHQGLRPTTDRVRETVFNWLQGRLEGARVLDLFAGSGAMGFEAASRGAAEVVMIDTHRPAVQQMQAHCETLGAAQVEVHLADAYDYIESVERPFDLVLVDPPFAAEFPQTLLMSLLHPKMLKANALVYLEAPKRQSLSLPNGSSWYRHREAGDVQFGLLSISDGSSA